MWSGKSLLQIGVNPAIGSFSIAGYYAKAKDVFPRVNQLASTQGPAFEGGVDEFLNKHKEDQSLHKRSKNKIRKCPGCGKVVAYTLPNCNQCGADLTKIEISYSNNVFVGFIYGIQKGPFPFTISLRAETPDFMVFDDLLALAPCHLNVIPTSQYLPDWRYLLKNPKEGKRIVQEMFNQCLAVLKSQFLASKEWRTKIIRGALTDEEIEKHVIAGLNFPPSQFQLHLQFMLPPFTPLVYNQYVNGLHFTQGRFFPKEYILCILDLNETFTVEEDTPIESVIEHFKKKGVDYDVIHKECYARYGKSHELLANWQQEDFEGIVINNKVFKFTEGGIEELKEEVSAVNAADKVVLQNYGRPYKDGKPTGSYYKFAKKVEDNDVKVW